ncbi:hypothetical protein [Hyphomicrobium denitrificans]|uniref:hypothetical protein n=1 Tax=Hyphomicrobium denitrificans TaxID=53399 RepID=UPI00123200AD|nr:hypothetical protein [Hyphomicrobium denitrificans]
MIVIDLHKAPAIIRPAPEGYTCNAAGMLIPDWKSVRSEIKKTRRSGLPGMFNPMLGFAAEPAAVPTYQDAHFDNGNSTSFSFTFTLPTPAFAGRWLLVAVHGYGTSSNRTVSSVTVFGNSATMVPGCRAQNTTTSGVVEFWAVQLDSGNTGTVAVTFSASMSGASVQIFSVENLRSITPTSTPAGSTAAPAVATLNIPAKGFGIGLAYSGGVTAPTATWSGLALAFTQSLVSSSVGSTSTAVATSDSNIPSLSASCTWSNTTSGGRCAVFATFR